MLDKKTGRCQENNDLWGGVGSVGVWVGRVGLCVGTTGFPQWFPEKKCPMIQGISSKERVKFHLTKENH